MVEVHVERDIEAPPERVFQWLADPTNLTATPLIFKAGWAKDSTSPGLGAVREATGAAMWFREEITAYDPPRSYSYRIVRSFPVFDHRGGTVTLTPTETGTHVSWVTRYTHPVRAGGKVMEAVSSRLLTWNLTVLLERCTSATSATSAS